MAFKIINFPDGFTSAINPPTEGFLTSGDKGIANGVCPLDENSKVPAINLPSYVDDVLEYSDSGSFPITGTSGIIYVSIATLKTYRWSGSAYVEISPSEVNSVNGQTGIVTIEINHIDTYANLLTWVSSATNGKFAYASDLKLQYIVTDNALQEVSIMKTINGTISQQQITVGEITPVRATVSGSAPNASRKRLMITPDKNNDGFIFIGGSGVTTTNGKEIIGVDTYFLDWDASDYYLIATLASQKVHIVEVV